MKPPTHLLVLAAALAFVLPTGLSAQESDGTGTAPSTTESAATPTSTPTPEAVKVAPSTRPTTTPRDCDDYNCDKVAPTKKPSPTVCNDRDEDCDGRVAPSSTVSPRDNDSDGDGVQSDERQTPKRDFGDRMKAGLQSIINAIVSSFRWFHDSAKSIISKIKA